VGLQIRTSDFWRTPTWGLPDLANRNSELKRQKFSHKTKLARYTNPLLILHHENDGLIEMSHAERNYKWSNLAKKRLVCFPKGSHNTILPANLKQYIGAVKEFADGLVQ
jgi:pimeloyl-ACP methyl ester carboxylesterase